MHLRLFATLIAATVSLTGCSKIQEKLTEKAAEKAAEAVIKSQTGENVEINAKDGKLTVQGKDGVATFGAGAKIPDDFPKSAPIYPGAKVQGVMTSAGAQGSGAVVTLTTPDASEKVVAFYKAAASKGKKALLDMATPAGQMIAWQAADDAQISTVITTDPAAGGTQIVVTAGAKKP
ncbi:MAG: hypothetical protein IPG50_25890 [Myxococcales bacterium]|nr:hypothetical protein [Myxococcales bacterium]